MIENNSKKTILFFLFIIMMGFLTDIPSRLFGIAVFKPSLAMLIIFTLIIKPNLFLKRNNILSICMIIVITLLYFLSDFYVFTILSEQITYFRTQLYYGLPFLIVSLLVELIIYLRSKYNLTRFNNSVFLLLSIIVILGLISQIIEPGSIRDATIQNPFTPDLGIVWSLPLVAGTTLFLYLRYKIKTTIVFFILTVILIFLASFMTSILITILMCSLALIYKDSVKKYVVIFWSISLILLVLTFGLNLLDLGSSVSNEIIANRSSAIKETIQNKEFRGEVFDRTSKFEKSITSFEKSNIFIGTGDQADTGGHSFWLDRLSQFGLIGTSIYLFLLIAIFKRSKFLVDIEFHFYFTLTFIGFIITGFFNPYASINQYLVIFVIVPIIFMRFSIKKKLEITILSNKFKNQK